MSNDFDDLAPSSEDGLILAFFSCAEELDLMIADNTTWLSDPVSLRNMMDVLSDYMIAQVNLMSFENRNTLTADECSAIIQGSALRFRRVWKRILRETDLIVDDPATVRIQQFVTDHAGF